MMEDLVTEVILDADSSKPLCPPLKKKKKKKSSVLVIYLSKYVDM